MCLLFHYWVAGEYSSRMKHTLSLWCMNPSVVFKDVAELSLSVILTSGLAPSYYFCQELCHPFGSHLGFSVMINLSFVKYRTLSPMDAFSSELGIQFDTVFVAPHVIDVARQVLINALYLATNSKTACMI